MSFISRDDNNPQAAPADEGSLLIIAIVMITAIFVIVFAALSLSSTNLRGVHNVYKPARASLYAADAAIKEAAAYVKANPTAGQVPQGGGCVTKTMGTSSDGQPVTVSICPAAGSFAPGGAVMPYAVIALATGSETGVKLVASGNGDGDNCNDNESGDNGNDNCNGGGGDGGGGGGNHGNDINANATSFTGVFNVNGGVFSNTKIDAGTGQLQVVGGDVVARSTCIGSIVVDATHTRTCSSPSTPAGAQDPNINPSISTRPANATGSCNNSTKIATLNPGTWTNSTFNAAIGSCDYVQLLPGIHYLEDVSWTVNDRVVAGTLTGSIKTSAVGAACSMSAAGAQLILGGSTQINIAATGSLDVCGIPTTMGSKTVRVPIIGLDSNITSSSQSTTDYTLNANNTATTSGSWSSLNNAKLIDGSAFATSTVAKKSGSTPGVSSATLSGFTASPQIPAGTVLSVAVATKAQSASNITGTLQVISNNATSCTVPVSFTTSMTTSVTALTSALCPTFVPSSPLSVLFSASNSSSSATNLVSLDGVELRYSTTTTTTNVEMKGGTGCVVSASSPCDLIDTNGIGHSLYLGGVTYAPAARISVDATVGNQPIFSIGLVVRALVVTATSNHLNNVMVGTDNLSGMSPGDVTLNASVSGVQWVSARITYAVNGAVITPTIKSWVIRT